MSAYAMSITMLLFAGLSARVIIRSINWLETDYWRHGEVQAPAATAEHAASVLAA
jgi:hypothetical protein